MEARKVLENDNLVYECHSLADAHVARRVRQGLEAGEGTFSVCERFGFAVTLDMKSFKALLRDRWTGAQLHALRESEFLVERDGVFATLRFTQKPRYSAVRAQAWAASDESLREFEASLRGPCKEMMVKGVLFGINWAFAGSHGLDDVHIEEVFEDDLLDEAYPSLAAYGGVEGFVRAYLSSDSTVLILQGPPGTGKTRLVRKILAQLSLAANVGSSEDYGSHATALYTGDRKAFESDEIFARFITGEERAFVVEDTDHLLRSRANGNDDLHRFLAVADGVVRAAGRKVIFSTNLPNISDVDEALTRPGRCFAIASLPALGVSEAQALAERLEPGSGSAWAVSARGATVAEVYARAGKAKAA